MTPEGLQVCLLRPCTPFCERITRPATGNMLSPAGPRLRVAKATGPAPLPQMLSHQGSYGACCEHKTGLCKPAADLINVLQVCGTNCGS